MMSSTLPSVAERALQAIERAKARVEKAEQALRLARADYRRTIRAAVESGESLAAVGRRLGVSRQRVAELAEDS
jgi:hypothetical protein